MCTRKCDCNNCFKRKTCTDCSKLPGLEVKIDCNGEGYQGCEYRILYPRVCSEKIKEYIIYYDRNTTSFINTIEDLKRDNYILQREIEHLDKCIKELQPLVKRAEPMLVTSPYPFPQKDCPKCKRIIDIKYGCDFCPECGQRLKWEVDDV